MAGGMTLYAGFDLSELGSFVVGFNETGTGAVDFTVTISSGLYYHTLADGDGYVSFAATLQTAINAARLAAGSGAVQYSVAFNHTTLSYNITQDSGGAITIVLTVNPVAQAILGYAASVPSAQNFASTVRPYYVIRPAESCISLNDPGDYKPKKWDEKETNDGKGKGSGPTVSPVYHDWSHLWEPSSAVKALVSNASVPWRWQHFFDHVGTIEPFVVVHAAHSIATVAYSATYVWARCRLRADGAKWNWKFAIKDLDTRYHVRLLTRVIERLSETL